MDPVLRNQWSAEEVEAAVDAYADLYERQARGEIVNRNAMYRELARVHGRRPNAYEYRFRNISHVLSGMGLPQLPGATPAENVGPTAAATIREVGLRKGYFQTPVGLAAPTADPVLLEQRTSALRQRGIPGTPQGVQHPQHQRTLVEQIARDPAVRAWVLEWAEGRCESCEQLAPFVTEDGTPYLEVHHVKPLGEGGSDTVTNAAAVCPNCHRRFHHGSDAAERTDQLYSKVARLRRE